MSERVTGPALYEIGSGGVPLVLLHGWGKSAQTLRPLAELLAWDRRVLLFDLPGFGSAAPPPAVWSTADYARCVEQELQKCGISECDLLGHSFGGRIGIHLAAESSALIRNLVLMDSGGLRRERTPLQQARIQGISQLRRIIRFVDRVSGSKLYETWYIPRFASRDYLAAGELRATFVKIVNDDLAQFLPRIKARTLVLWGADDSETPLEVGVRMHRAISGSSLIVLDGHGHEPYDNAGHHLCAFHIRAFLAEQAREAAHV